MMVFRRRQSLRPIKTDKHEVVFTDLAKNASSVQSVNLAVGTPSADKDSATEVEIGSHVKSIYVELNIAAETVTNPKVVHWAINLARTGETIAIPSLYYQDSRSRMLKRGMEMLPKDVATVYKRIFVVRIPRSYQRMAANTFIQFRYIATSTETINICGFFIYKEFY